MTIASLEQLEDTSSQAIGRDGPESLRQLHAEMLKQVAAARSKRELHIGLAEIVARVVQPAALFYFGRNSHGRLLDALRLLPANDDGQSNRLAMLLSAACQKACRQGTLEVRHLDFPAGRIIAAPVVLQGRDPEALGFVFSSDHPAEQSVMLAQLVACHLVLWHVLSAGRESEHDASAAAAIIELLDRVAAAPDLRSACVTLAAEVQSHLNCGRVAVGLRPSGRTHCRLFAVSGVAQFDPRSPTVSSIEAAMDETILRGEATIWPAADEGQSPGALAHKSLCSLEAARSAVSTPLRDRDGAAIGALLLLDDSIDRVTQFHRFLLASERSIAESLTIATRLEGGPLVRLGRTVGRTWRMWQAKIALAALTLAAASMAVPLPYRLHCDCQIEPVTRRFIAAPFESTLEKSLVKPGDIVRKGDLLVRLDGREIRWKRASVVADQNQAIKKRDSAQAVHNYSEMQIAALEVDRLDLELRLLDHRAEHLDIKSPVDGIVVSGDLERAEGAPLVVGQTLFEIAPLQQMVVEVSVHDADVSFVRAGQPITVRLDAYPHDAWQAELATVHPRSEIRDDNNVFVAEAPLDNPQGRLSPGMKGLVTIETGHRPLGWILFHKPWEYAGKLLSW